MLITGLSIVVGRSRGYKERVKLMEVKIREYEDGVKVMIVHGTRLKEHLGKRTI